MELGTLMLLALGGKMGLDAVSQLMSLKETKATRLSEEKQQDIMRRAMAAMFKRETESADKSYERMVSARREDRSFDRENMVMNMAMANKQMNTATIGQLLSALVSAARPAEPQSIERFGPPSSLVSLLR